MARKKSTESNFKEELKKNKKYVIGKREVLKNLRYDNVASVYLASNCDEKTKSDVEYYASIVNANVSTLPYPNDELGIICKRQHSISVIAFLKE